MDLLLGKTAEVISIHALREERDRSETPSRWRSLRFQSTRSARSATSSSRSRVDSLTISIHALREERDAVPVAAAGLGNDFNPRAPRGARRQHLFFCCQANKISIHALREERDAGGTDTTTAAEGISIHALREERDTPAAAPLLPLWRFQSTRSARSAT